MHSVDHNQNMKRDKLLWWRREILSDQIRHCLDCLFQTGYVTGLHLVCSLWLIRSQPHPQGEHSKHTSAQVGSLHVHVSPLFKDMLSSKGFSPLIHIHVFWGMWVIGVSMSNGILLEANYRQSKDIWDLNPVYSSFVMEHRKHNPIVDTGLASPQLSNQRTLSLKRGDRWTCHVESVWEALSGGESHREVTLRTIILSSTVASTGTFVLTYLFVWHDRTRALCLSSLPPPPHSSSSSSSSSTSSSIMGGILTSVRQTSGEASRDWAVPCLVICG